MEMPVSRHNKDGGHWHYSSVSMCRYELVINCKQEQKPMSTFLGAYLVVSLQSALSQESCSIVSLLCAKKIVKELALVTVGTGNTHCGRLYNGVHFSGFGITFVSG